MSAMSLVLALLLIGAQEGAARRPRVEVRSVDGDVLLVGGWFGAAEAGVVLGGNLEEGPAVLLRTTDGGARWDPVAPAVAARLYDVHFPTVDEGWAVGLHGTVLRTTDRGATWTDARDRMPADLRTRDGGSRWQRVEVDSAAWLRAVAFHDDNHGVVVGANGRILEILRGEAALTKLAFPTDRIGYVTGSAGYVGRIHLPEDGRP